MPKSLAERNVFISIIVIFCGLGVLFAWRVPDWQAPDEPAHYNYVAQVAIGDLLPVIEMGDWDDAYLETLKANDFAPNFISELDTVQYENHQPPLYYWLAAPIFFVTDGSLFAVRMVSVVLAILTIVLSYFITLEMFPQNSHLALAVMALVAFLPQNLHISASVNNDALAGVVGATLLLLCIRYLKYDNVPAWLLGLMVGIVFITKTTIYFMAGVVVIVIFMRWLQEHEPTIWSLFRHCLGFALPTSIFAIIYWGRNILTYGFPDFLGLQAHDAIVIGQKRRVEFITENGLDAYWNEAIFTTFHSFWGQFGWMEARLGDALPFVMWLIVVLMIASFAGLALYAFGIGKNDEHTNGTSSIQTMLWMTLGWVMFFALAQYVYYNVTFVQFQGRYLFVALIPFAIGMVLGIDNWRRLLLGQWEASRWLVVVLFLAFVPLDLYLIWRVIPCAVGC